MNPVVNGSWIPSSHCTPIRPSLLLQCIRAVIIVVLELTQVALLCTPYTFSHSLGPQALHLNLREIIVALSFKPCCPRLACPLLHLLEPLLPPPLSLPFPQILLL